MDSNDYARPGPTRLSPMTATYRPVRDLTDSDRGALLYIREDRCVRLVEVLDPPSPATVLLLVSEGPDEHEIRLSAGVLLPVEDPRDYLL